jgi:outer membrane protein OmpA-like peptidoglycan-associated protein
MKYWLGALAVMLAGTAQAVELKLPANARQMVTRDTTQDRYFAPIGPFSDGVLPAQMFEGVIARSAWRVDVAGLTPLQIVKPLQDQLLNAGFRVVFDCAASVCGGYDFRFATEVLPAPNMYVNIRNYHVITALRGSGDGIEAVAILASASSGSSFVQIIQVGGVAKDSEIVTAAPATPNSSTAEAMFRDGHAVLEGLDFKSGTSELGAGPFAVLESLAETLRAQPNLRVALVGHTDNIGGLDGNINLSRNRATAVRARLIEGYDIAPSRLQAEGMGYLAPFTTNLTEAGRETNRRVEAVVLAQ